MKEKINKTQTSGDEVSLKKKKLLSYKEIIKNGLLGGFGWAIGVTLGFVFVSTVLVVILNMLGGLPLIGGWIASVVEATQEQLLKRTPIFSQ